jgi:hypothetical protein
LSGFSKDVQWARVITGARQIVGQKLLGHRVDAIRRNDITREGLPLARGRIDAQGVEYRRGEAGEIAIEHGLGGGEASLGSSLHLAKPLIIGEEEQPVAQDRPARRSTELIAAKGSGTGLRLEEIAGVQCVVPQEFEGLTVETVASGFGNHIHNAGIRTHGRHDEPLHHLELVDGRDGDIQRQVTQAASRDRDPVDSETDQILLDTGNRDVSIGVACLGGQEIRTGGPAVLRGPGEITQLQVVAAVQGKLLDVDRLDQRPQFIGGWFQQRRGIGCLDSHALGHRTQLQLHV